MDGFERLDNNDSVAKMFSKYDTLENTENILENKQTTSTAYKVNIDDISTLNSAKSPKFIYDTNVIKNHDIIENTQFGDNVTNTCSSVATGIYLTYLDKTVNNLFVPTELKDAEKLHQHLIPYIESKIVDGSEPLKIKMGINNYFKDLTALKPYYDVHADFMWLTVEGFVKQEIQDDKPIIICLGEILGSSYKDHTVVCYGYKTGIVSGEDGTGTALLPTEVIIHAGWDYQKTSVEENADIGKWIPMSWVAGATSISWEQHEHKYKIEEPPTARYHTYICECGNKKEEEHKAGAWIIINNATCARAGSQTTHCQVCNANMSKEVPINLQAHFWGD